MPPSPATKRKQLDFFESRAAQAESWREKNPYYYQWISRLLRFFIPAGGKVLEVGSGLGDLLASVQPAVGVGIDFSQSMVAKAGLRHTSPQLRFIRGDVEEAIGVRETFDFIVASDLVGYLNDIQTALENIRVLCHERTRLILTQYNRLWEPVLHLGARFSLNQPKPLNNWLSAKQLVELLELAGFEVVTRGQTFLCPKRLGGAGDFINRTIGRWPLVRRLCLVQYFVARPRIPETVRRYPVSIIVPVTGDGSDAREFMQRVPSLGSRTEIIFVIPQPNVAASRAVTAVMQDNAGRRQLALATSITENWTDVFSAGAQKAGGELLISIPPDLSIAPEELPKFYQVIADGKADCVVGSRLVYPSSAIRIGRRLAIRCFSSMFSWIIGQRVTDAKCPAIALRRDDCLKIFAANKKNIPAVAGMLVGAAKLGLKIAEIPVHWQTAAGGVSHISDAPLRTLYSCWRQFSL